MTEKEALKFNRMYFTLRRITRYQTPERMRRASQKDWGLGFEACLEMAYENVIGEAKSGLKGIRPQQTKAAIK